MKIEEIFYVEGRGYIATAQVKSDEKPKIGDRIIVNNQEVMIVDIERFHSDGFPKPFETIGMLIRGYQE